MACSREPQPTVTRNEPKPKWMTEDFSQKTVATVTATAPDPDLKPYTPTKEELAAAQKIGVLPPPEKPQFVPPPLISPARMAEFERREAEQKAAEVIASERAERQRAADQQQEAAAALQREALAAAQAENDRRAIEAQRNAEAIANAIRDAARKH